MRWDRRGKLWKGYKGGLVERLGGWWVGKRRRKVGRVGWKGLKRNFEEESMTRIIEGFSLRSCRMVFVRS